jgi:Uma2 family endonuclease
MVKPQGTHEGVSGMSDRAAVLPSMTPQEYFAFEENTPLKHEFLDGVVYAMVGASIRHNTISLNIAVALRAKKPRGCEVFISDVKLKVKHAAGEFYYYPDVVVSCSQSDRDPLFREQPALLIEVASPSTVRIDREEKLNAYQQIPSLSEYVIVGQDQPLIEIYRRRNNWAREVLKPDEDLALESVTITLSRAQIYEEISF